MLRHKHRLQYDPNSHGESNFDDVFLHSIDEHELEERQETGCMPPFLMRFIDWISFWKHTDKVRTPICDIDSIV
jgi:hypothetical protein